MTVIVAIRDGKSAVIGADSGLAVGDLSVVSADSKIVRIGRDVAFGIAGPTSAARIAEKAVAERWPSVIHCPSARDVADTITDAWKDAGIEDDAAAPTALIVAKDALWQAHVGAAFRHDKHFAAIGSGGQVALGAMIYAEGETPFGAVVACEAMASTCQRAMEAASMVIAYIRRPFVVEMMDAKE